MCVKRPPHPTRPAFASPSPARGEGREQALRRGRHHYLGQKLLALLLRTATLHGRGKALENAVLERRDDGVVHIALAADRRRVGEPVGGGAERVQNLALWAASAFLWWARARGHRADH